jgi:hypothetical protein
VPDRTASFTTARVRRLRATEAGALYAITVFVIGFILGTTRVLLLTPRLGETMAVTLEVRSYSRRVGPSAAGAWIGSMSRRRSRFEHRRAWSRSWC